MVELVMVNGDQKELFMAALLSCTKEFKDAKARKIKKGENKNNINVTSENVKRLCPSWASSELISRMIMFKVYAPVLDNPNISIDNKVISVKNALEKQAKLIGIEMPAWVKKLWNFRILNKI